MAPFLRASLHGVRSTLCSQRERCLLKLPESKYVMSRWYGKTATAEESSTAANDSAGENGVSINGSSSLKMSIDADGQRPAKETSISGLKQENASEESATDKLTSLILGKMRSRNNSSSTVSPETGSTSSKAAKPTEETNESVRGDKWDQVMESMRNMAAKRREQMGKGITKPTPRPKLQNAEDQDDFADLDSPVGDLSKALSDPSTDDVSPQWEFLQESKEEAKKVRFSFLKSLESDSSTASPQSSGAKSLPNRNVGLFSSSKPKDDGLQAQPTRKETKRLSFEFLKSPDLKSGPPLGIQAKSNGAARTFSLNEKRESNTPSGSVDIPARTPFFDEPKRESNSTMPTLPSDHVVCVRNLPNHSNLALIKEALSIHGEVVSSFKKPNSDGSCSAFIEFKTSEAMDEALAMRWLQIDSKSFGIVRADSPITTVVRLTRVSANTTDTLVQAMCEKFGSIDQVRKRGNGVYDVFYKTAELSNMFAILDSLNEVTLNQRRWVALPAPLLHPVVKREVLKSGEGQAWHAQQLNQTLSRLEMGLEAMSVYFEDLKSLVAMEDEFTK